MTTMMNGMVNGAGRRCCITTRIHLRDAVQYLNGRLLEVTSFASTIINDLEAEDTIVAIGRFSNKSAFELTAGCRPEDIETSISFTGDKVF